MRRLGWLRDLTSADVDAGLEHLQDRQLARYEREVDRDTDNEWLEYLDELEQEREDAA